MQKILNQSITNTNVNKILGVLQNPSQVLHDRGLTTSVYKAVNKQPDIFSASQNYKDAISSMEYVCNDVFIQEYLMKNNLLKSLPRLATTARDYGIAIIEIIEYQNFKGKIVPTKLDLCDIDKFHFDTEGKLRLKQIGNALGVDVMATYPNKFIVVQNDCTIANPYGTALLDVGYWLSVGLNGNFEFMLNFAEEDGRDKWVATCPPGTTDEKKHEILLELAKLRANGIAIKEEGTDIEPKDFKGRTSTSSLYKDINEILIRKVEKLWYGTDLTMQVEGKGGYSSSQTGINIREDALGQGQQLAKNALLQLVDYINRINSSAIECEFTITSKNETTKAEAEVDKIYFDMGLKPTKEFFTKRGYEESEFELVDKSNMLNNIPQNFNQKDDSLLSAFDIFKNDLTDEPKK